jgi:hypothetical protein
MWRATTSRTGCEGGRERANITASATSSESIMFCGSGMPGLRIPRDHGNITHQIWFSAHSVSLS